MLKLSKDTRFVCNSVLASWRLSRGNIKPDSTPLNSICSHTCHYHCRHREAPAMYMMGVKSNEFGGNSSLVFTTSYIDTKPAFCQYYFMALKHGCYWWTIPKKSFSCELSVTNSGSEMALAARS